MNTKHWISRPELPIFKWIIPNTLLREKTAAKKYRMILNFVNN